MKVNDIPVGCSYWYFGNGAKQAVMCEITGCLCQHKAVCDLEKIDPTGYFRERIDARKAIPFRERPKTKRYWLEV